MRDKYYINLNDQEYFNALSSLVGKDYSASLTILLTANGLLRPKRELVSPYYFALVPLRNGHIYQV